MAARNRDANLAVLRFLRDYWREHGEGPTPNEIALGLGAVRTSIASRLERMRDHGLLDRMKLTDAGEAYLDAPTKEVA